MSPETETPVVENHIDPHHEWRMAVDRRLDEGSVKMETLRSDLALNTVATKANADKIDAVKTDTSDLVNTFKSFQGAMDVLNMLGKLARPLSYIVMLGSAIWGVFTIVKGGGEPPR